MRCATAHLLHAAGDDHQALRILDEDIGRARVRGDDALLVVAYALSTDSGTGSASSVDVSKGTTFNAPADRGVSRGSTQAEVKGDDEPNAGEGLVGRARTGDLDPAVVDADRADYLDSLSRGYTGAPAMSLNRAQFLEWNTVLPADTADEHVHIPGEGWNIP